MSKDFSGQDLSYQIPKSMDANANLQNSDLSGTNLSNANFVGGDENFTSIESFSHPLQ